MEKLFSALHEPEEYTAFLSTSTTVVTASSQAAVEVKASGAKVIFLLLKNQKPLYPVVLLQAFGIEVINGFDIHVLDAALKKENPKATKTLQAFSADSLLNKL
ncbi:hypothetical protein MNB_SV-10-757 [hydrothermal vent metagenome]|uniref:Uncharacterized protein n=1 Tax=hydrothermal vent metagenome TaxID=652676 RepID=A0A1W1CHA8_9ZZZZ